MAFPDIGEPLTGSYTIPNGTARLFTNGVTIQHSGSEVIVAFPPSDARAAEHRQP